MRKLRTKKEIEEKYNESIEMMNYYIALSEEADNPYLKETYQKESIKYASDACCYGWVLGKEGY